jgi:hypothetical protein
MSANVGAKEIVTEGLVLYLDASNYKSYTSGSTVWNDMSISSNNGTLTNAPSFNTNNGGSIVFDGVDDYVAFNGSIITSTATFILWIKRNGTQTQYDGILFSRSAAGVTGVNFYSSNQLGYHWNANLSTYQWASGLTIPDLSWCMCAVSVSTSSATAYLGQSSGVTSATNNVSNTSTTLNAIELGRDKQGGRLFTGNIASAQIYNKALSASEVLQNYNATKARFGLT